MSAPGTRETLLSQVYAGNQHGAATLRASVQATEELLALTPAQRRRTVWRTDGGFGSDDNINWLLGRGYQVLSKGYNLLAWTHGWMLSESPFATWGLSRLVQEGLCIPGRVVIKDGRLEKVALLRSHPYAGSML